jgi:glycosyltransferase involved in cell wall biosynthesis
VRTLKNLDLVFYQSNELLQLGTHIAALSPTTFDRSKHMVLSRGIPEPQSLARDEVRKYKRQALGIDDEQLLVLYVGRVNREKGVFELLQAMSIAVSRESRLKCVIIGCKPGFDDSWAVEKRLAEDLNLKKSVQLLPACEPDQVCEYLCAADIFAFPSHNEGMPNSLLEAMAMEVPAISFAIPPALEINNGSKALVTVPPTDSGLFAEAILHLAACPEERRSIAAEGKAMVLNSFMVRKSAARAVEHLSQLIKSRDFL